MFEMLVARTRSQLATAEPYVPLAEQAFARAALSRLAGRSRQAAVASLTYLSGPEGIGKSLLARKGLRDIRRQNPRLVSMIASATELGDLLTAAAAQQCLAEAIEQFSRLQVLVCEDLQNLQSQAPQQVLLLELIEQLRHLSTPVLLTSRKPPGELRNFSSRWISRCHGGLCANLAGLGRGSQIELLTQLCQSRQLAIAEPLAETLGWIADHHPGSPRDLQQLADNLAAEFARRDALIDIRFLTQWFSTGKRVEIYSLDAITAAVAGEFGISAEELRSRSRLQGLIVPRQCAMYLARELTGRPLESIGHYFGDRTHTTVSHCLSRLKELLPHAPSLRQQVQRLRKRIADSRREDCA